MYLGYPLCVCIDTAILCIYGTRRKISQKRTKETKESRRKVRGLFYYYVDRLFHLLVQSARHRLVDLPNDSVCKTLLCYFVGWFSMQDECLRHGCVNLLADSVCKKLVQETDVLIRRMIHLYCY